MPNFFLCVEIILLKEGRKSAIIDQINADIVAYSSKYERILFVVYDLGVIRDEVEFRRDIENVGENIKVLVIKHNFLRNKEVCLWKLVRFKNILVCLKN